MRLFYQQDRICIIWTRIRIVFTPPAGLSPAADFVFAMVRGVLEFEGGVGDSGLFQHPFQPVHKVLLGHVVNYGMGVHYPASVELFVSADNKNFVSVDKMTFSTMEIFKDGIFADELIFDGLSTEGRYLKFVLKSPGKTPQFHHRTGQGVWLRFDEIVVL